MTVKLAVNATAWDVQSISRKMGLMSHHSPFIRLMAVSGYSVFQSNCFSTSVQQVLHRQVVAVLCFVRCTLHISRTLIVVKPAMKDLDYLSIIADQFSSVFRLSYIVSDVRTGQGVFQQDKALFRKTQIILEWLQKHNTEFRVIYWPSISSDLNPIENIWNIVEHWIPWLNQEELLELDVWGIQFY